MKKHETAFISVVQQINREYLAGHMPVHAAIAALDAAYRVYQSEGADEASRREVLMALVEPKSTKRRVPIPKVRVYKKSQNLTAMLTGQLDKSARDKIIDSIGASDVCRYVMNLFARTAGVSCFLPDRLTVIPMGKPIDRFDASRGFCYVDGYSVPAPVGSATAPAYPVVTAGDAPDGKAEAPQSEDVTEEKPILRKKREYSEKLKSEKARLEVNIADESHSRKEERNLDKANYHDERSLDRMRKREILAHMCSEEEYRKAIRRQKRAEDFADYRIDSAIKHIALRDDSSSEDEGIRELLRESRAHVRRVAIVANKTPRRAPLDADEGKAGPVMAGAGAGSARQEGRQARRMEVVVSGSEGSDDEVCGEYTPERLSPVVCSHDEGGDKVSAGKSALLAEIAVTKAKLQALEAMSSDESVHTGGRSARGQSGYAKQLGRLHSERSAVIRAKSSGVSKESSGAHARRLGV